jgi:hypothetical protein
MVDIMEYLDWRRDESEVDSSRCFRCDDKLVDKPEKIWGRSYCVDCAIGVLIKNKEARVNGTKC